MLYLVNDGWLSEDWLDAGVFVHLKHWDVSVVDVVHQLLFLSWVDVVIPLILIIKLESRLLLLANALVLWADAEGAAGVFGGDVDIIYLILCALK